MKRVRMLVAREVDGLQYRPDQVVDFPDGVAKELINLGEADGHKDAVGYCVNVLKAKPLVHETEASGAAKKALGEAQAAFDAAGAAHEAEKDAAKKAEAAKTLEAAKAALEQAKAKADAL